MRAALPRRVLVTRALHARPFALLWVGQTVSSLGDGAFLTALAWQVLVLTGSGTAMGLVLIATTAPQVAFVLLGGVVADRLPRRLVLLWADAGRGVIVLLIAGLGALHLLQFWHLVALGLAFGVADGFFLPAYQAIAPQLVETDMLPSANALTGLGRQMGQVLGPLLGAGLVALARPAGAFAFDGATFLISALCLLVMRPPASPPVRAPGDGEPRVAGTGHAVSPTRGGMVALAADVRQGLGYVRGSTWLWVTITIAALANMGLSARAVALPKLIHDGYGAGVWLLGVLGMATAGGSIAATLLIGQMRHLRRRGLVAYLGILIAGIALIVYGLPLPRGDAPLVVGIASVFLGGGLGGFGIIWVTVLQELVPPATLGRVSSIDILGSLALLPVGYALAGVLTDHVGPRWVFIAGGSLNVILTGLALCVREIRDLE